MTLGEALRALHEQGRLRSPWLPGMAAADGDRWADSDHERYQATRDSRWLWRADVEPNVTDPATVGCLFALLREAAPQDDRRQPYAVVEGRVIAAALIELAQAGGGELPG